MRNLAQQQVDHLQENARIDLAPYVVPVMSDYHMLRRIKEMKKMQPPSDQLGDAIDSLYTNGPKYTARLYNASESYAFEVRPIFYDQRAKKFLPTQQHAPALGEGYSIEFFSMSDFLTREQLLGVLAVQYRIDLSELDAVLSDENSDYILVLFQDKQGRLYYSRELFDYDGSVDTFWNERFEIGELPVGGRAPGIVMSN